MSLIGNVLKPLAKTVLIPLGLAATASATDAAIHKKMFRSGNRTLISWNEEMNDIMKIVKSLRKYGLLMTHLSEKMNQKNKKVDFLVCC